MLRRKPTAITLTSEDVAAYEDRQAANMDAATAAASLSQSSRAQGIDSSQALGEIEAARQQQQQQLQETPRGRGAGAGVVAGTGAAGALDPAAVVDQVRNASAAQVERARTTRSTRDERIGVTGPSAASRR